jgi:hypothetical protein
LGRQFCQNFKNRQNSTFAQNSLIEKEEAKNQALENLKKHGWCDPSQLGHAFGKAEKDKVLKNPVPAPLRIRKPIRPGTPIRTKSGEGDIAIRKSLSTENPKTIFSRE